MSGKGAFNLANQSAQLALAVPKVMANRLDIMAQAGLTPNAQQQQEMFTMGAEKVAAFYESWWEMGLEMAKQNQKVMLSLFTPWTMPRTLAKASDPKKLQHNMLKVLNKGMQPVSRRAVANAKRLG